MNCRRMKDAVRRQIECRILRYINRPKGTVAPHINRGKLRVRLEHSKDAPRYSSDMKNEERAKSNHSIQ